MSSRGPRRSANRWWCSSIRRNTVPSGSRSWHSRPRTRVANVSQRAGVGDFELELAQLGDAYGAHGSLLRSWGRLRLPCGARGRMLGAPRWLASSRARGQAPAGPARCCRWPRSPTSSARRGNQLRRVLSPRSRTGAGSIPRQPAAGQRPRRWVTSARCQDSRTAPARYWRPSAASRASAASMTWSSPRSNTTFSSTPVNGNGASNAPTAGRGARPISRPMNDACAR